MAGTDLTSDFNGQTDIFGSLFRLFTGGPSSSNESGSGFNLFSSIGNFLKMIFSWLFGGSSSTPSPSNTSTQPAAPAAPAATNNTSSRSFTQTLRDGWNSATGAVGNFIHGAAFDVSRAASWLKNECHSCPTGHCLASVENALDAAGLRFSGNRKIEDVMPVRNGTHYAKDLAGVLGNDSRFKTVGTGYGAQFASNYTPKVGDIVVWQGGQYGHTQMFTGYDGNGNQKWISDFATNGSNWTGLANANSHGSFQIFRQRTTEEMAGVTALKPSTPTLTA